MKGLVYKSTGSWYIVKTGDGRQYNARIKGVLKIDGITSTNLVAANLDQSLLIATLRDPKTSQGFIDRFLVSCEAFHVPAIILFNKADLYKKKEMERFELLRSVYESV